MPNTTLVLKFKYYLGVLALILIFSLHGIAQPGDSESSDLVSIQENDHSLEVQANDPGLISELADIQIWCHLGYYFADKLRAGVALEIYNLSNRSKDKEEAIAHLENCLRSWKEVVRLTTDQYKPMPYVSMGHHEPKWPEFTSFHWSNFLEDVEADIEYVINIEKRISK